MNVTIQPWNLSTIKSYTHLIPTNSEALPAVAPLPAACHWDKGFEGQEEL